MVSIATRMRRLRGLLAIKLGPGAAVLPPEVTRIHMDFALNIHDGHYGPRKFWRDCLPRLKYHNPAVSMTVNRTQNQEGPALMSVHYTTQSPAATTDPTISTTASKQTPPVAGSELGSAMTQIKTINMKHRSESEILDELMKLTEARAVKATVEDMRQIRELEEQNRQSELEAVKSAELNAEKKRQKAILDQARGEMGLS